MRSFTKPFLVFIVFGLFPAVHGVRSQSEEFEGVYLINPDQDAVIASAVEGVVGGMNFVKRPIARSRLLKVNPTYQRIDISRSTAEISIAFDSRKPVVMPADGRAIQWTREDGEKFEVSARAQNGALTQRFKGKDGERTTVFKLNGEGLSLEAVITSSLLPMPLQYSLAYRKQADGK